MAVDPVIGPIFGPINTRSDKDRNTPGKTSGGVPANFARTRSPGPRNPGGNARPKASPKRKPTKDQKNQDRITIPVARPVMTFRRGSDG
jgi:hypothetical protein